MCIVWVIIILLVVVLLLLLLLLPDAVPGSVAKFTVIDSVDALLRITVRVAAELTPSVTLSVVGLKLTTRAAETPPTKR